MMGIPLLLYWHRLDGYGNEMVDGSDDGDVVGDDDVGDVGDDDGDGKVTLPLLWLQVHSSSSSREQKVSTFEDLAQVSSLGQSLCNLTYSSSHREFL